MVQPKRGSADQKQENLINQIRDSFPALPVYFLRKSGKSVYSKLQICAQNAGVNPAV
jgi:hypothetical protein